MTINIGVFKVYILLIKCSWIISIYYDMIYIVIGSMCFPLKSENLCVKKSTWFFLSFCF